LAQSLRVDLAEATNGAVVRALAAVEAYSPAKGPLAAWLLTILRNTLYQIGRDARRHRAREPAGQGIDVADDRQICGLDLLLAHEQAERARALLDSAGAFVQEIARLREEGHTFRQIAEQMGAPMTLVTSRWFAWCRSARLVLSAEEWLL
jgi:DNA-directed RNA polymerase specialized sigma24 family protein